MDVLWKWSCRRIKEIFRYKILIDEEAVQASPLVVLIGILFIGCMISSIVRLVLGIIGVFSRKKKKVLAVWGIILNLIITAIFTLSTISSIFNENILDSNYYMLFISW